MSAKKSNVRGAGAPRPGATDTTMLIWKTIDVNPGITRDEIFAKIEHEIPAGWAKRRYLNQLRSDRREIEQANINLTSARRYVVNHALRMMIHNQSITRDGDNFRVQRAIKRYKGNRDHVDESGTKAAEHLNAVYAGRTIRTMVERIRDHSGVGGIKISRAERDALITIVDAGRI